RLSPGHTSFPGPCRHPSMARVCALRSRGPSDSSPRWSYARSSPLPPGLSRVRRESRVSFPAEWENLLRHDREVEELHSPHVDFDVIEDATAKSTNRHSGDQRRNQATDRRAVASQDIEALDAGVLQRVGQLG